MENKKTIKESIGILTFLLLLGGGLMILSLKIFNSLPLLIVIIIITFLVIILNIKKEFGIFHKIIYLLFASLSLLIGYGAFNKQFNNSKTNNNIESSNNNHLEYSDYEECGKDLNKWKEVIDDLYDKAVADIADDGIWNEDGDSVWDTWEYRRTKIFDNLEKIVDERFKSEVYNYEVEKMKNIDKEYPKVKVTETLHLELLKKFNLNY